jgi:hypothetical protein
VQTDRRSADERRKLLAKERARIAQGQTVGGKLRAPVIVVDKSEIRINGYRVCERSVLSGALVPRLECPGDFLAGLTEHWRKIHPDQKLERQADVTLPADLTFFEGANLFQTLGGYGRHVTVHAGDRDLALEITEPPPPDRKPGTTRRLDLCHGADWQARSSTLTDVFPNEAGRLPYQTATSSPWRAAPAAEVASVSKEICAGGCDILEVGVESNPPTFHDALDLVVTLLDAGLHLRSVAFAKCSLAPP